MKRHIQQAHPELTALQYPVSAGSPNGGVKSAFVAHDDQGCTTDKLECDPWREFNVDAVVPLEETKRLQEQIFSLHAGF